MFRSFLIPFFFFGMIAKITYATPMQTLTLTDTSFIGIYNDSIIDMPFKKMSRRSIVADVTVINSPEILKNDYVQSVGDLLSARIPGMIGLNLRGLGNMLVVIDGIPGDLSVVTIDEIEQISVLKDANAAVLYGTYSNNGIILIRTKRGIPNKRKINIRIEKGLSSPISFPKYLSSANYMELYNEALKNDGLVPLYSLSTIEQTRSGTNPVRYPSIDFYNSDFLNRSQPSMNFVTELSGGNDISQYYLNLGWGHSGSLIKDMGNGRLHSDRLNLRSNIDLKINNFINSHLDLVGVFNLDNTANGNFYNDASIIRPNAYAPLFDTILLSNKTLINTAKLMKGKYLIGGSSIYQNNPYGYLGLGGFNKDLSVAVRLNTGLDFNLKGITEGLSFNARLGLDFNNEYTMAQTNTYAVYQPNWSNDVLTLTKIGQDAFSGVQEVTNPYLNRKITIFGSLDYHRTFRKEHNISASIIGFIDKFNETKVFQPVKHSHVGSGLNYTFKNKYIFDFSSAFVSSAKLAPGNRIAFSPSLGLGWVLSEENFLKNSLFVDLLEVRVSGGIINTDLNVDTYWVYEDVWANAGGTSWGDGARSGSLALTTPGNVNIFYEKRKEMNIGLNAILFNRAIWVNATIFREYKTNIIEKLSNTNPEFLGGLNSFQNFGENKYSGIELGLYWKKTIGSLSFDIGSSMTFTKSEAIRVDELWPESYLYRAGKSTSSIFGLEALGLFKDDQDIANHAFQQFGEVQPGDIKYKDQNNDEIIDANDQIALGSYFPDFVAGLTVKIKYKDFTLIALATSSTGASSLTNSSYYWILGDRKYPEFVTGRWTKATSSSATYPRLSSKANSNNFQNSTFWAYDNSNISLNRLQLNYDVPASLSSRLHISNLNFYLKVHNLATFSKNRDKMQLNIGNEPQYRFYAVGAKIQF